MNEVEDPFVLLQDSREPNRLMASNPLIRTYNGWIAKGQVFSLMSKLP